MKRRAGERQVLVEYREDGHVTTPRQVEEILAQTGNDDERRGQ